MEILEKAPLSSQMQTSIQDVVLRWRPNSVGVLTGTDSRIFSLSHHWMVRHYIAERKVCIIDCAVRFDSLALVDELLRLDIDVDSALECMDIRRAFTPYQIMEALAEARKEINPSTDVIYLLAPFKQFFDSDVAGDEAEFLLHMMIRKFASMSAIGQPMIVVETASYQHAAFPRAYHKLRAVAQPLWEIMDIVNGGGKTSILRTHAVRRNNGKDNRTILNSNGARNAQVTEIPQSVTEGRSAVA